MQTQEISLHPIFAGMTRPPMFLGITIDYLMSTALFVVMLFMLFNSATFLILYIPLHILGWIGCKLDPNFFKVFIKKPNKFGMTNKSIWGAISYEPF